MKTDPDITGVSSCSDALWTYITGVLEVSSSIACVVNAQCTGRMDIFADSWRLEGLVMTPRTEAVTGATPLSRRCPDAASSHSMLGPQPLLPGVDSRRGVNTLDRSGKGSAWNSLGPGGME